MPKISIIIPNYNHAAFLQDRISSVLNQTLQDYELIILDDCSTDNSQEIIEKYRNHPKVAHTIFNEVNSGSTFRQWKKGIDLAQGEYIWIAESDDYCSPSLLTEVMKAFSKDNSIVLSYCNTKIIDSASQVLGHHKWANELDNKKWTESYIAYGKDEINKYLSFRNTVPNASAVVFRKDIFLAVFDETILSMKYCGDWLIWGRIIKHGKVSYSSKELNFFRVHNQTTRNVKKLSEEKIRFKEYIDVIKELTSYKPNFLLSKYDWIVEEWRFKVSVKRNFFKCLLPDFPFALKLRLYLNILRLNKFI